MNYKNS